MDQVMTDPKDRPQLPAAVVVSYQNHFIRGLTDLTKLPIAHWMRTAFDLLIIHLSKTDPVTFRRVLAKMTEEDQREIADLLESQESEA